MKKDYIEPQLKICFMEFCPLMDQTTTDVHTDDPQDPGGALGNSNNVWEEDRAWNDQSLFSNEEQ